MHVANCKYKMPKLNPDMINGDCKWDLYWFMEHTTLEDCMMHFDFTGSHCESPPLKIKLNLSYV